MVRTKKFHTSKIFAVNEVLWKLIFSVVKIEQKSLMCPNFTITLVRFLQNCISGIDKRVL